jgi:hypothetical protein
MNVKRSIPKFFIFALALSAIVAPAVLQGEILYLKDGSELKGKVISFEGDTLVFAPSFGGRITVHRSNILKLVLDDSGAPAPKPSGKPAVAEGPGVISVVFKNDKLTSKIAVTKKMRDKQEVIEKANWIEQIFIVGSDTVFAKADTTMDKTIYKGHEKELKNTIRLEDMQIKVDAGVYQCMLIVRNRGAREFEKEFTEGPLDLLLEYGTVGVYPNQTTSLVVGIDKGFLRMGSPKLVEVGK